MVIDLQNLAEAPPFNMAELGRRLRQHQLVPIGVQNATEEQNRAAVNAGWSIFPEGRQAPLREPRRRRADAPRDAPLPRRSRRPTPSPPRTRSRRCRRRGGRRLAGAADHPAGPLRAGRSTRTAATSSSCRRSAPAPSCSPTATSTSTARCAAGRWPASRATPTARIFCRSLEAELVSVAGYWRVREDIPEALIGKPAQIFLDGDRIAIEPLA